jgi:dihydrofolate reductase
MVGCRRPHRFRRLPVFVVCSEPPPDVPHDSVYTFVTVGIESALQQAADAAGDRVVCVMGGAETARGYLAAGLVDELSIYLVPVLFGSGASLFDGLDVGEHVTLGHVSVDQTREATHLRYRVVR